MKIQPCTFMRLSVKLFVYVNVLAGNGFNKWPVFRSMSRFKKPTKDTEAPGIVTSGKMLPLLDLKWKGSSLQSWTQGKLCSGGKITQEEGSQTLLPTLWSPTGASHWLTFGPAESLCKVSLLGLGTRQRGRRMNLKREMETKDQYVHNI